MVRFLHTADWHLGIKYSRLGGKADLAREIRMETVRRLLESGEDVDFILVAGDLFDGNEVDSSLIHETCKNLSGIGTPVYILPGNHDPLTRDSAYNDPVWDATDNIHILKEAEPVNIPCDVTLYPCPVNQKQSKEDPTAWIEREDNNISIGLAHGNLQIPGFTDESNFPINPKRADTADLDYLALGEWHSLFQYEEKTLYPGTPETTKFGENKSGNAVMVDLERGEKPTIKPARVGKLRWEQMESNINGLDDIKSLETSLENQENLVLNLKLRGVVGQDSFDYLENFKADDLFFFNLNMDDLYLKPNMLEFQAMIPEGSYVPKTFQALMALMKYDPKTNEFSGMSAEDAEAIFREIRDMESVQNASPEVLKRASLMLYQMVKEVSQ